MIFGTPNGTHFGTLSRISPNGRIVDLITHPASLVHLITCHYAFVELFKHQGKKGYKTKQALRIPESLLASFILINNYCATIKLLVNEPPSG